MAAPLFMRIHLDWALEMALHQTFEFDEASKLPFNLSSQLLIVTGQE